MIWRGGDLSYRFGGGTDLIGDTTVNPTGGPTVDPMDWCSS